MSPHYQLASSAHSSRSAPWSGCGWLSQVPGSCGAGWPQSIPEIKLLWEGRILHSECDQGNIPLVPANSRKALPTANPNHTLWSPAGSRPRAQPWAVPGWPWCPRFMKGITLETFRTRFWSCSSTYRWERPSNLHEPQSSHLSGGAVTGLTRRNDDNAAPCWAPCLACRALQVGAPSLISLAQGTRRVAFRRHIRPPGSQDSLSDTHILCTYSALTPSLCTSLWLTALLHVHPHCLLDPLSISPLSSKEHLSSPVIPVKRGTSHQCKKGSQLLTAGDEQRSLQAGLGLFEGQVLDCSLPGLPSACLWFSCLRPSQDWDLETWLRLLPLAVNTGPSLWAGAVRAFWLPQARTGSLFKPQSRGGEGSSCTSRHWFSLQCLAQQALEGHLLTSARSPPHSVPRARLH